MKTNRDLYLAIQALGKQFKSTDRTLEDYLRALLMEAEGFASNSNISIDAFYNMLEQAFTTTPAEFDETWREQYDNLPEDSPGYDGWHITMIQQIVDLHEMRETGTYENKYRYFGVTSPRGSYWFNFDPVTYLECATVGTFGGWEPDDDTGRGFVPGPVAVLTEDGAVAGIEPQDIPRPHVDLPVVTWEDFERFIFNGQTYE